MAEYVMPGNRYVVDEDDFSFSSYENNCCSAYDFVAHVKGKEEKLKYELNTNRFFSRGWEKANRLGKPKGILSKNELLSVVTYTLENPRIYQEFNSQLREYDVDNDRFQFQGMHFFLHSAINKLSAKHGPCHVYRGVTHEVKAKKGDDFHFTSFASASLNIEVAKTFGTNYRRGFDGEFITIFEIQKTHKGAKIGQFSDFPEEEVLIPPCEEFKVQKVDKIQNVEWNIDDREREIKTKIIHLKTK